MTESQPAEQRQVENFQIDIPLAFADRLLGLRPGARPPRASVRRMMAEELHRSRELIEARAVMALSHGGLPGSAHVDDSLPLVAVVCTIGPALEDRVGKLARTGDSARAMVLDAIGSAAAEHLADRANELICQMAAPTDLAPGARRSPGYGGWDLREQRILFDYLEPAIIGVALTESCMMVPRKSVSYIVPLGGDGPGARGMHRCQVCGLVSCPYRLEPAGPAGATDCSGDPTGPAGATDCSGDPAGAAGATDCSGDPAGPPVPRSARDR